MSVTPNFDEVLLDGFPFKAVGGVVNRQNLATFQRKSVIGDYTRDSNPVLSTWVMTDWAGGHGIHSLEEGADVARYRFGVINARSPRQLTIPEYAVPIASPNDGVAYPLGQIAANGDLYFAFDTDIYEWDEANAEFDDTTDNLTGAPVARGVSFKGKLYIPLGTSFDTYDGATVANETDFNAVSFTLWDRRLLGLASDGQIWQTLDGSTWTNDGDDALIDESHAPRKIVPFYDRQDFPLPMVVTDQGVWAFDPSGPSLYQTEVMYPAHRDHGLGAAKWRGELFLSVGMGVTKYNGSIVSAMGLDRDQGLPDDIRGKIVDLLGEYNGLYALVSGAEFQDDFVESLEWDATDDQWYASPGTAVSSLHIWTAYGWHCLWASGALSGNPTWMCMSSTTDAYRLWFGYGDYAITMKLPTDFANARALIQGATGSFAPSGYLETGFFDAGMTSYTKIANSVIIRTSFTSANRYVRVSYRLLATDGWTVLGTATTPGETLMSFGDAGLPFKEIEFRFDLVRDASDTTTAPLVDSVVFSFLKTIPSYSSFNLRLDMMSAYKNKSPKQMQEKLDELIASTEFFEMKYRDETWRVRIAQGGGSDFVAPGDYRSDRMVSIIEVREDL